MDSVSIGPGETVTFKPGGMHLMMMKLKGPIKMGARVEFRLYFAGRGVASFVAPAQMSGDAMGGQEAMDHGRMGTGGGAMKNGGKGKEMQH